MISGVGTVAIFVLRSLVPYRSTLLGISKLDTGIIMAVVSYVQALTALCFVRCNHRLMYKLFPVILAGFCGIAALMLFTFTGSFYPFLTAAVLFGMYSGFFYFFFVYHALISPRNSTRYVAINEIIVGVTGTIGPLTGGLLSSPEASASAFPATAVLCACSIICCGLILKWKKPAV